MAYEQCGFISSIDRGEGKILIDAFFLSLKFKDKNAGSEWVYGADSTQAK